MLNVKWEKRFEMTNKGNHSPTYIREICVICDSVFLREIREICESVIPSVIFPHP